MVMISKTNNIKGALLNIQSVTNKTLLITETINNYNLDFFVLTETWLTGTTADRSKIRELTPPHFRFIHKPRLSRGGGVGVILSKNFKNVTMHRSQIPTSFEILDFSCNIMNRKLRFITIYRPEGNFEHFLTEFEDYMNELNDDSIWTLISGDLNIWVDDNSSQYANRFKDLLNSLNLENNIHFPTAASGHTLDLVITNYDTNLVSEMDSLRLDNMFHFLVLFNVNVLRHRNEFKLITYRSKRNFDPDRFIESCYTELMGSTEICTCVPHENLLKKNCVDCFCKLYNKVFSNNFNAVCPVKTKKINTGKDLPWFDSDIREARKERRRYELRWRRSGDEAARTLFNESRNHVRRLIQKAKKKYYNTKIQEYSKDSRKLNQMFDDILGNITETTLPIAENDESLANDFATFFDNKVVNIVNTLTSPDDDSSIDDHFDDPVVPPPSLLEKFDVISEAEIKKIITSSKTSSNDLDPCPMKDLIKATNFHLLVEIITFIVNLSWNTKTFPDSEKTGIIKPLYKGEGNANELKFYRPVTSLSFLSKVIEKATLGRLNKFLDENNILPSNQSAYQKFHSTESTVTGVLDDLLLEVDKSKICLVFMLDLSAAFDTVDHDLLLQDLSEIGLGVQTTEWFKSYLRNRHFKVKINNTFSKSVPLPRGVPQGSVAGPNLFLIYTRRLTAILDAHNISYKLFADDTQGYHLIECYETDVKFVVDIILKCKKWLRKKLQKLNEDKSKLMFVGKKTCLNNLKTSQNLEVIFINNEPVKVESVLKNLGTWFDENLTLRAQVMSVVRSTNLQLRNISYIRKYLTISSLKTIATQQILSRIDYCNSLYIGLPNSLLRKLQVVMNKTARMIYSKRYDTRASPLLIELHWLPLRARIEYKICCLTHTAVHHGVPAYLKSKLQFLQYGDAIATRNSRNPLRLVEPRVDGSYGARSFSYNAPRLFNKLPQNVKSIVDSKSFKKKLKTIFFSWAFDLEEKTTNPDYKI